MKRIIPAILAVFILGSCALADPAPTLTLLPLSGDVSGAPGAVVGWGFTLNYAAPSDWVVLTGSEFTGSQVQGTYVDYLSGAFYVAGPAPESPTIVEPWNASSMLGVGEFDINATAPPGINIPGDITVHYSIYSQDPNDPNFDPGSVVVADATLSDPVQVAVNVPESSSLSFLMCTLVLLLTYPMWGRHFVRPLLPRE